MSVPDDVLRFTVGTGTAIGRAAFIQWLTKAREEAVHVAIYGSDPETRSVNAGRAQAYSEFLSLFTDAR